MRKAEKVCNTYKEMLEYIGLTDRQAKEIYLKHQKKKTFDELAKEYDITRVRIIATCGRTGRRYNPFRDICNDYKPPGYHRYCSPHNHCLTTSCPCS